MGRPAKTSPDKLLDAAEDLVAAEGAGRLTLDAVAARAGVTKGALVYSFPSKEALLKALIARYVRREEEALLAADPLALTDPHRELAALVRVAARTEASRLGAALMAAAINDPVLLEPARDWLRLRIARLRALGPDANRAFLLMLAVDGLWQFEMLGVEPFGPEERQSFIDYVEGEARRLVRDPVRTAAKN